MFKKVLIAEDQEMANVSIQKTLKDLAIKDVHYVYYCDDALARINKAIKDGDPFDLLITDLVFEDDMTPQKLSGGEDLVAAAIAAQPDLKIIVLSSEGRSRFIDNLFKSESIHAYVRKARRDAQYIKEALEAVYQHKTYQSPEVKEIMQEKNSHDFTTFDIHIINLLADGVSQKEIPDYLAVRGIRPSSLSSVEKRLNHIRSVLGFTKNEQLLLYCSEQGII